jgi:tetratricopeptide (TPR) repeat protein
MRAIAGVLIAIAFHATSAWGSQPWYEDLARAQSLRAARDYEGATAAFKAAQRHADMRGSFQNLHEHAYIAFDLARTYEEWAEADPGNAQAHLQEALTEYRSIIRFEPDPRSPATAAAYNNAAQVCLKLASSEEAQRYFQQAIASSGELSSFYFANYATFLSSTGRSEEAVALFEKALALKPDDAVTEAKLLRLYPGPRVAEALWRLVERNELERAASLALDNLQRDLTPEVKRDLLGVVAVTLARTHVTERQLLSSSVATRLDSLSRDPAVGSGVRELFALYRGTDFGGKSYSWWKTSPAAFSLLARELGDQLRKAAPAQAERYFALAIEVTDGRDADALVSLADFYYRADRREDLRRFTQRYRDPMIALAGNYRYHVAFGTIYARAGWDGDSSDPGSAIYHLEHARASASKTKAVLDPRSVDLLAASYRKQDPLTKKDLELRLDVAEQYLAANRAASAKRVLAPVVADPRVFDPKQKLRFDDLNTRIPRESDPAPERDPSPVTRDVNPYVKPLTTMQIELDIPAGLSLNDAARARLTKAIADKLSLPVQRRAIAEKTLEKLGVVKFTPPLLHGVLKIRTINMERVDVEYEQLDVAAGEEPVRLKLHDSRMQINERLSTLVVAYLTASAERRPALRGELRKLSVMDVWERAPRPGSVILRSGLNTYTVPFRVGGSKRSYPDIPPALREREP